MPMPISVSISDFRNRLATYLEMIELDKATILLRNEKRDKEIARILPVKERKSADLEKIISKTFGMWSKLSEKQILKNSPLRGARSRFWLDKARSRKIY